jgi:outer membrane protein OmpA-like peptidoglycan-associated protein
MRFPRPATTSALAVAALCVTSAGAAALAQSADDIITALRPPASAETGSFRGIRPVAQPGGTASAAPRKPRVAPSTQQQAAAGVQAQPAGDAPSLDMSIQFRTGSADLTPAAMSKLDQLGKALSAQDLAAYRFRIEGHTDTVGSPELNKTLSEQRAAAVVAYLTSRFGVASNRLQAVGMGEEGLAIPTGDQVAEPRNRRVHIVNLGS